jgi:tRNA pseudouridine32 synthase/23S rRNA pseudouridine746 synthase
MVSYTTSDLIIYADEAILVVNKPVGLLSLQDGYDKSIPHLSRVLALDYGRIWMVHRLDRETSGVMVVARSAEAHRLLNDQFKTRQVTKHYHALVIGAPPWEEKELDVTLRKDGDRQHRTTIDPRGKPSRSSFKVVERFYGVTLIDASPHTGYTHQIRTHLAYLGFPLLGDALYGKQDAAQGAAPAGLAQPVIHRVALHALCITFIHPTTLTPTPFSAPYPLDFTSAVEQLRIRGAP